MERFIKFMRDNRTIILVYTLFPIGAILLKFSDTPNKKFHYIAGAICFFILLGIAKPATHSEFLDHKNTEIPISQKSSKGDLKFKGFGEGEYSKYENGIIAKKAGLTEIAIKYLCDVNPEDPNYQKAQEAAKELNFPHCGKAEHILGRLPGGVDQHLNKTFQTIADDIFGKAQLGSSSVHFTALDDSNEEWEFSISYDRLQWSATISLNEPCMRNKTCKHSGYSKRSLTEEELRKTYSINSCPLGGWLGRMDCNGPGRESTGGPGRLRKRYKKFDQQMGSRK